MTKEQAKKLMARWEKKGVVTLTKRKGDYTREAYIEKMNELGYTVHDLLEVSHVLEEL